MQGANGKGNGANGSLWGEWEGKWADGKARRGLQPLPYFLVQAAGYRHPIARMGQLQFIALGIAAYLRYMIQVYQEGAVAPEKLRVLFQPGGSPFQGATQHGLFYNTFFKMVHFYIIIRSSYV